MPSRVPYKKKTLMARLKELTNKSHTALGDPVAIVAHLQANKGMALTKQ